MPLFDRRMCKGRIYSGGWVSRSAGRRRAWPRYAAALAECAERLPVGDPTRNDVAMGPIIDERQRDNVHRVVTASVDAGATQYPF